MWGTGKGRGFTLLELLVVLAILALLTLAIPVAMPRLFPAQQLRVDGEMLASSLRSARTNAQVSGEVVRMRVGPNALTRESGESVWDAAAGVVVSWSADSGTKRDTIAFYPDGSSSGGRFQLALGRRIEALAVSPLTGRVVVGSP